MPIRKNITLTQSIMPNIVAIISLLGLAPKAIAATEVKTGPKIMGLNSPTPTVPYLAMKSSVLIDNLFFSPNLLDIHIEIRLEVTTDKRTPKEEQVIIDSAAKTGFGSSAKTNGMAAHRSNKASNEIAIISIRILFSLTLR
jgi:hypothetical protein